MHAWVSACVCEHMSASLGVCVLVGEDVLLGVGVCVDADVRVY